MSLLSKCHLFFLLLMIKLSNKPCISSSLELTLISCSVINVSVSSRAILHLSYQEKLLPPALPLGLSPAHLLLLPAWVAHRIACLSTLLSSSLSLRMSTWSKCLSDKIIASQPSIAAASGLCQSACQPENSPVDKRAATSSVSQGDKQAVLQSLTEPVYQRVSLSEDRASE